MALTKNLKLAFAADNLYQSWVWLNTSNGPDYKGYFRSTYKAYGLSSRENIEDLYLRLRDEVYEPSHSTKVYIPKKSGILRPYTLLNIEDQIVYQALASIIARRFKPFKPFKQEKKEEASFSYKYNGKKDGLFFYSPWTDGYKRFNERLITAFEEGDDIIASFDLAAFYDSICHKVLTHILIGLGFEKEFCSFLKLCLEKWSSTDSKRIYHGHGIPQGPLSSGIIADLILNKFDEETSQPVFRNGVVYARYVDDIKLLSRDSTVLRKALLHLDWTSKNIGVFPQSGKINIHKIYNIFEEIKTLSDNPFNGEENQEDLVVDQAEVVARLNSLIATDGAISDETDFKYTLGYVRPNAKLTRKLLLLARKHHHLAFSIVNHVSKSKVLSKANSDLILENIRLAAKDYQLLRQKLCNPAHASSRLS